MHTKNIPGFAFFLLILNWKESVFLFSLLIKNNYTVITMCQTEVFTSFYKYLTHLFLSLTRGRDCCCPVYSKELRHGEVPGPRSHR